MWQYCLTAPKLAHFSISFQYWKWDFLLWFSNTVHTCDVDAKFMLDLAVAIVENTAISTFILLFESFYSQHRLIGSSIGPNLEPLAFVFEVFEAFEPLDCRHRVSKHLQHGIDGLLFGAWPLVAWFVDELGRSFSTRFERRRFPVPRLKHKNCMKWPNSLFQFEFSRTFGYDNGRNENKNAGKFKFPISYIFLCFIKVKCS